MWIEEFISQTGKEILIKAVVQALPTYNISVFLLTKVLCSDMNSLMLQFWWGLKENDSKKIKKNSLDELGKIIEVKGLQWIGV